MPPWILVTPSSRGIGLALSRRLLRTTNLPIIATARKDLDSVSDSILSPSKSSPDNSDDVLSQPGDKSRLHVLPLDVTSEESISSLAQHCESHFGKPNPKDPNNTHLHLAFCIPGILHAEKAPGQLDAEKILEAFKVNAVAPLLLMKYLTPFLPRKAQPTPLLSRDDVAASPALNPAHATFAAMSARVGSITDNKLGGWYSYRASKAAVTQAVKTYDHYLKTYSGDNAMAVGLHPGTVKTGLSQEFWGGVKPEKLFTPEYAAERLVDVVRGWEGGKRGLVWDHAGTQVMP